MSENMNNEALIKEFERVTGLLEESRRLNGDWDYDLVTEWMPLYEQVKKLDMMITYKALARLVLLSMEKET